MDRQTLKFRKSSYISKRISYICRVIKTNKLMKQIANFFKSGFRSCTGHTIATQLYYYEGKPEIGFIIRKHYVMFWLSGYDKIGVYVTKQEALEDAKKLGITL